MSLRPCQKPCAVTFWIDSFPASTRTPFAMWIPRAAHLKVRQLFKLYIFLGTIAIAPRYAHIYTSCACSHMSYLPQGHAAPTDVQPLLLTRLGRSRTNYGQFIPYVSKDITDYAAVYQAVKNILRDVFDWLQEKVRTICFAVRQSFTRLSISLQEFFQSSMRD